MTRRRNDAAPWWAELRDYSVQLTLTAMGLIALAFDVKLGAVPLFLGVGIILLELCVA